MDSERLLVYGDTRSASVQDNVITREQVVHPHAQQPLCAQTDRSEGGDFEHADLDE